MAPNDAVAPKYPGFANLPLSNAEYLYVKAAVLFCAREPMVVEDVSIDDPGPQELRVRTVASGLCHSDLSVANGSRAGRFPTVLGHEVAGVVEQVGNAVSGIAVGDHVVTSPFGFCGICQDCLRGNISICAFPATRRPRGSSPRLWLERDGEVQPLHPFSDVGGFANEVLVHQRQCVVVDRAMPLDRAAIMGCAVVTGIGAVLHSAEVEAGETVAVLGCGGVGLAAVQGARLAGADRIIAVDRNSASLELAERLGATDIVNADRGDVVDTVLEITAGGVHHCIEAVGSPATISQAFAMLRRGGQATVVGLPALGTRIELDPSGLALEKKIRGSLMGSNHFPVDVPQFTQWYLDGRLDLDSFVTRKIALGEINDAFAEMEDRPSPGRTVIEFS